MAVKQFINLKLQSKTFQIKRNFRHFTNTLNSGGSYSEKRDKPLCGYALYNRAYLL